MRRRTIKWRLSRADSLSQNGYGPQRATASDHPTLPPPAAPTFTKTLPVRPVGGFATGVRAHPPDRSGAAAVRTLRPRKYRPPDPPLSRGRSAPGVASRAAERASAERRGALSSGEARLLQSRLGIVAHAAAPPTRRPATKPSESCIHFLRPGWRRRKREGKEPDPLQVQVTNAQKGNKTEAVGTSGPITSVARASAARRAEFPTRGGNPNEGEDQQDASTAIQGMTQPTWGAPTATLQSSRHLGPFVQAMSPTLGSPFSFLLLRRCVGVSSCAKRLASLPLRTRALRVDSLRRIGYKTRSGHTRGWGGMGYGDNSLEDPPGGVGLEVLGGRPDIRPEYTPQYGLEHETVTPGLISRIWISSSEDNSVHTNYHG